MSTCCSGYSLAGGGGGLTWASRTETGDYTADASTDWIILFKPSSVDLTCNLPAVASSNEVTFWIKHANSDTNKVTIDPDGGELINGATTFDVNTWESATIYCDGTEWFIL